MKVFTLEINDKKIDDAFTTTEVLKELSRIKTRIKVNEIVTIKIQRLG